MKNSPDANPSSEAPSDSATSDGGGSGPTPVKIVFETPREGQTFKRGTFPLLVQGFEGRYPNSNLKVSATSNLFGEIDLVSNFEKRGSDIYGANITLGKDIEAGTYEISVKGERASYDEERIQVTIDPTIHINMSLDDSYQKGERINIQGVASYFDGTPAIGVPVTVLISAGEVLLNTTLNTTNKGGIDTSFLISFAEPDGKWNIQISMQDEDNSRMHIPPE